MYMYMYLLCLGNYTFAVIKGAEKYELLQEGLAPVLSEINSLIEGRAIELEGTVYELKFELGGDYKVI